MEEDRKHPRQSLLIWRKVGRVVSWKGALCGLNPLTSKEVNPGKSIRSWTMLQYHYDALGVWSSWNHSRWWSIPPAAWRWLQRTWTKTWGHPWETLLSKGFWDGGGSLAGCCSAFKESVQYPGEFFLLELLREDGAVLYHSCAKTLCPVLAGSCLERLCLCLQWKNSPVIFPSASSSSWDSCVVFLCHTHKPSLPCFEIPTPDRGKCLHCSWHLLIFFRWLRAAGTPHYFFISQFEYSFSLTKRVMGFNSSFTGVCAESVLGPR